MTARIRLAVLLGAFVGLRLGETCGLRPEDIDFMRGVVHPHVQYPAEPLKTKISQTPVPVPTTLGRGAVGSDRVLTARTEQGRNRALGP